MLRSPACRPRWKTQTRAKRLEIRLGAQRVEHRVDADEDRIGDLGVGGSAQPLDGLFLLAQPGVDPGQRDPRDLFDLLDLLKLAQSGARRHYWYQTPRRVLVGEWESKFWLALEAARDHRSDAALVRVVVPAIAGHDDRAVEFTAAFARKIYPLLRNCLPR